MYLLIDNYDSFTYNIFQYMCELTNEEVLVIRNDRISLDGIEDLNPRAIILSPGPGRPEDAGICVEAVRRFAGRVPILGICLGHQAIAYAFGGVISGANRIVHGKAEPLRLDGQGLFRAIPSPAVFTRYHSLVVIPESFPGCLEVTATSTDGEIMGLRHREFQVEGIQFHPESYASEYGRTVLKNFINYRREPFELKTVLTQIISGKHLSRSQSEDFMDELTEGNFTDVQTAAFLTALNAKGIDAGELAGCASVLKRKCLGLSVKGPLLDTCGTGGDDAGSFNISSLSALVAAAAGARVAKHGNRAVSSRSGSADFYRELGIPNDLPPERVARMIEETGFGFLFAPVYHNAMKHAARARKELGIKTIMNLLGPLANPAGAKYQLIGVFADEFCLPVARAAVDLGAKRVMTVHSLDGLDEISVCAPTRTVFMDESGRVDDSIFDPAVLSLPRYTLEDLKGGSASENAGIARAILGSAPVPENLAALTDAVSLNSGAALFVCGLAEGIKQGYLLAKNTIESGAALAKFNTIRDSARRAAHD